MTVANIWPPADLGKAGHPDGGCPLGEAEVVMTGVQHRHTTMVYSALIVWPGVLY